MIFRMVHATNAKVLCGLALENISGTLEKARPEMRSIDFYFGEDMPKCLKLGRVILLSSFVLAAGSAKSDSVAKYPVPEDGVVANGEFRDDYFGLRYPLPEGWTEDLKGPEPSATGYYSLVALKPEGELTATMQISAQDNFFAAEPVTSATGFLMDVKHHLDPSLSAPEALASTEFGGRHFARLNYSGAGLNHSVFATEIRCHTLIFSITSSRPEMIASLTQSLQKLTFAQDLEPGSKNTEWPLCIENYVESANIVHKVEPVMTGPRYASVPVRLIIGSDGNIEHLHAISGFPEQIKSVTDALAKWEFKPYMLDGVPTRVETGILFQFPRAQTHSTSVQ